MYVFYLNSGELGSKASRESRFLTESTFGHKTATSTNPRKVDMTIRIFVDKSWADEICIFECKPEVSDLVCHVNQGKSVRLNTAILLALEKGLDIAQWHPIIAETRTLTVDFYALRRYGDIIGAGRATQEKVWLPSGYNKLDAFLSSRTFEVLLGFRVGAFLRDSCMVFICSRATTNTVVDLIGAHGFVC